MKFPALRSLLNSYEHSYRLSIMWAVLWGIVACIVNTHTIANVDDGWSLFETERMVNGFIPYTDFYENNPSLILWLLAIPVCIAHVLGMNVIMFYMLFMVVLAGCCLWLVWHEIKRHPLWSQPCYGNIVFAALAQVTLGCSFLIFGQREHLFLLLALPFFIQSSYLTHEPENRTRQWLISIMAAVGLAIKPYYVIIWVAGEIYSAVTQRRFSLLFRRSNGIIVATGVLYCIAAVWFTPQYFSHILPMVFLTYKAFGGSDGRIYMPLFFLSLMYLLPACLIQLNAAQRPVLGKLACWFLAAVFTVWIQNKGFINHYYPAITFGSLLLASVLAIFLQQWKKGAFQLDLKHFSLLWSLGVIVFALPAYHLIFTRSVQLTQRAYIQQLRTLIAKTHSEGKPLYILSFQLGAAFPAVNYLPVTFPFHFPHLWTMPGIIKAEKDGTVTGPIAPVRDFTLHIIAQDFATFTPALVLVDTNVGQVGLLKDFDFIGYFSQNAVFSAQWRHYRETGKMVVDGKNQDDPDTYYTVYSRITTEH